MAEIFIVTLSNFVNLFLEIISRATSRLAVVFMSFSPVLELVITGTVECFLTLATLEKSLFAADLAARSRTIHHFLHHSISAVIYRQAEKISMKIMRKRYIMISNAKTPTYVTNYL